MSSPEQTLISERADLLETLTKHRYFLPYTVRDLTDEQAARRTTASELCLGGLIKPVVATERGWIKFILDSPSVLGPWDEVASAKTTLRLRTDMLPPGWGGHIVVDRGAVALGAAVAARRRRHRRLTPQHPEPCSPATIVGTHHADVTRRAG